MECGVSSVGSEVYRGLWNEVYPVWGVMFTKYYGMGCIQCGK